VTYYITAALLDSTYYCHKTVGLKKDATTIKETSSSVMAETA